MEPANDEGQRLTSKKPAVNLFEYLKTSRGSVQSSSNVLIKCQDGVLQLILPSISPVIPEPKVEQFDASDVVDTVMKEELDLEEENSPTFYKFNNSTNIYAMKLQDGNIKCSFCVKCGENICGGKKGLESHHKRFHKPQICSTCGVEVKGWQNMHQHKRQCEKKTCENCFKQISRKTFSRHFKACTGAVEGEHSCDQCDYKTYRKDQLKRHKKEHNKKYFKCEECDYQTLREDALENHKKRFHGKKKKDKGPVPHKCEWCDFTRTKKSTVIRHQKTCPGKLKEPGN